ncbi:MAG: anti-ECFsigma factor, ChrR [Candidatus Angelobacter sp.]|jgi:hypothetical protein|nr:anti-ECFsigma factor, ChrR [Candidatus Angelobacter sp.]
MMTKRIVMACLLLSAVAFAQTSNAKPSTKKAEATSKSAPAKKTAWNPDEIQWGPAPPSLPAGAQFAVLEGDPSKPGLFTIRLKAPDGYKVQPHWHATTEDLTVISGTFNVGMGPKWDQSHPTSLSAGGFASMPARMKHFAWTSGETVLQVHGNGPFVINYVNPADNPVQPKKTAPGK